MRTGAHALAGAVSASLRAFPARCALRFFLLFVTESLFNFRPLAKSAQTAPPKADAGASAAHKIPAVGAARSISRSILHCLELKFFHKNTLRRCLSSQGCRITDCFPHCAHVGITARHFLQTALKRWPRHRPKHPEVSSRIISNLTWRGGIVQPKHSSVRSEG